MVESNYGVEIVGLVKDVVVVNVEKSVFKCQLNRLLYYIIMAFVAEIKSKVCLAFSQYSRCMTLKVF